jgi:hypothetical protein
VAASKPDLNTIAAAVADTLLNDLSAEVQSSAEKAGWPKDVASSLSVKSLNGLVFLDYPDHLSNQIMDLEYGTLSSQPVAVIRNFKARNSTKLTELTANEYAKWIMTTGGGVF